jgi:MFS family permease
LGRRGRRAALATTAAASVVCWLILPAATVLHRWTAILQRAVIGLTHSAFFVIVPLYVMEISPLEKRSAYGSLHQFGISLGCFLVNLIGAVVSWQVLAVVMGLIPLAQYLLAPLVPESPVSLKEPSSNAQRVSPFRKANVKGLTIGFLAFVIQQASGINPIQVNLSQLMKSRAGPTIAASAKCIAGFLCLPLIATGGRRGAWVISCCGCAAALFLLAASWGKSEALAIAATFGYLFCFCLGIGPIPWSVLPELFDDATRSGASSFLVSANTLLAFGATFMYGAVGGVIGYGVLIGGMGIISGIGVALGTFAFPEPEAGEHPGDGEAMLLPGERED